MNYVSLISSVALTTALNSCRTVALSMLSLVIFAIEYLSPPFLKARSEVFTAGNRAAQTCFAVNIYTSVGYSYLDSTETTQMPLQSPFVANHTNICHTEDVGKSGQMELEQNLHGGYLNLDCTSTHTPSEVVVFDQVCIQENI